MIPAAELADDFIKQVLPDNASRLPPDVLDFFQHVARGSFLAGMLMYRTQAQVLAKETTDYISFTMEMEKFNESVMEANRVKSS